MSFSLIAEAGGREKPPSKIFDNKMRIGTSEDCDYQVKISASSPFHCEIYKHGLDYKLSAPDSSMIKVNNSEVDHFPLTLVNGDKLEIAGNTLKFQIVNKRYKRHWKGNFIAYSAVALLLLLVVFELFIIIWLPIKIDTDKKWERSVAIQEVLKLEDHIYRKAKNLSVNDPNVDKQVLFGLKTAIVDSCISNNKYLREYKGGMNREQIRDMKTSLLKMKQIVDDWDKEKKDYLSRKALNPQTFLSNIKLEKVPGKTEKK